MLKRTFFYFVAWSALFTLSFTIDDTPLQQLIAKLEAFTSDYPQEKVHLHIDKPYYAIGEEIWIKAYVVTAQKNEPSHLSKVLYVDLIDSENDIRKNLRLQVENGIAFGNISLLDSLPSGKYRIRAYTNYMRNYSEDFFFEKFITIGNVAEPTAAQSKDEKLSLDLQFFPEGGNLVKGIRSKIGVKAVTSDGFGANLSGSILNKHNEKVAEFTTEHAGMGVFALLPQSGEKYTALVILADGSKQTFNLPAVSESGFAIAINSLNENINVRISASADLVNGKEVNVIAQSNGMVYASFSTKVDQASSIAVIPKKSLPTGIIHFTLFNAEQKPVAERLMFINHHDELKITVKNPSPTSGPKKKMPLDLLVTDINGNPVKGNFSVAVLDDTRVPVNEDDETTILSNLLLTSDLKGYVEQPNYYFNGFSIKKERQLDNLMLTQGWTRFIWQDVADRKDLNLTYRAEQTVEITGKVTTIANKPLPNAKVLLVSNTVGYNLMIDTVTDAKGNFVFERLEIPDSVTFIVQAKTEKDKSNVKITIDQSQNVQEKKILGKTINLLPYLDHTKEMYKELQKNNMLQKGIQLETVTIKAFKPKEKKPIANSKNISQADFTFNSEDLALEVDMLTAISKMPGVRVVYNFVYRSSTRVNSINGVGPMLIILDGVQFNQGDDPDFLKRLNPSDVEGVELIISNYNTVIYGQAASTGIIHITTKHGKDGKYTPSTNLIRIKNRGFSVKKEFYSPNYDDPKTNKQMHDLRSTIYWNPNLNTNDNGEASFSFFNASTPSTYRVVVEGLDSFGNIGRKVYTYQVK